MEPQIMWACLNKDGRITSVHHKRKEAISECTSSLPPQAQSRPDYSQRALWRECQQLGHKVVKVTVKEHTVSQGPFSEYGS